MPAPFDEGTPRPAGVHLHWAMPDALLRGTLDTAGQATANRMGLAPLPDRWVVLRLLFPDGAARPDLAGWVLEADRAAAVPLRTWTEGAGAPATAGGADPDASSPAWWVARCSGRPRTTRC